MDTPSAPVIASLVVGRNLATSVGGTSHGLRTGVDRERFLALRNSDQIGAIVVGARTAAVEPYQSAPHPLFIYHRNLGVLAKEFIDAIRNEVSAPILCEGGVRLLHQLLRADYIDYFHLARVAIDGESDFFDISLLQQRMILSGSEEIEGTTFEKYERASR